MNLLLVLPTNTLNSTVAHDDFASTAYNTALSGNSLDNDTDPENDIQATNVQTLTLAEGTFTMNTTGDWTFTPDATYLGGTVNIPYQVCDNGTPIACAKGTIYIVVYPPANPDYKPTILTGNTNVIGSTGVVDFRVLIGDYLNVDSDGTTDIELRILKNSSLNISFDPNISTFNGAPVNNADWVYDGTHPIMHKFIYVGNGGVFKANSGEVIGINALYNPLQGSNGFYTKVINKIMWLNTAFFSWFSQSRFLVKSCRFLPEQVHYLKRKYWRLGV